MFCYGHRHQRLNNSTDLVFLPTVGCGSCLCFTLVRDSSSCSFFSHKALLLQSRLMWGVSILQSDWVSELGRFVAELSQEFLFFLHKDSSSLIKHSPSLCLDIPNLFFFLFLASWGFFFVFLCFVLIHLIWGDSFSWNKVSLLPSVEAGFPTKGLGDRKNPGEGTQCLLFLLL